MTQSRLSLSIRDYFTIALKPIFLHFQVHAQCEYYYVYFIICTWSTECTVWWEANERASKSHCWYNKIIMSWCPFCRWRAIQKCKYATLKIRENKIPSMSLSRWFLACNSFSCQFFFHSLRVRYEILFFLLNSQKIKIHFQYQLNGECINIARKALNN